MASLNHIGLFVKDIESSKSFFEHYFGAKSGEKYHNPRKSFTSYMLYFDDGAKIEIMSKPDLSDSDDKNSRLGYAYLSISVGSKNEVDLITRRLIEDGYTHVDGPRITGDGFYESAVLDSEGNIIEITV